MDEKKFVTFKKEELGVKEYVKSALGKGRISSVQIEYTPVGEKIVIATNKPGLVIGRKGEKIDELTAYLKKNFHLDNPHIEIKDITDPRLDAQLVADDVALALERKGSIKFKIVAYKVLQDIMNAGALGAELVLSGKLPSERARTWRFSDGYLKKTGEPSKVVDRAMAQAVTPLGVIGIKVSILPPTAVIHDKIVIDNDLLNKLKSNTVTVEEIESKLKTKKPRKKASKKSKEKKE